MAFTDLQEKLLIEHGLMKGYVKETRYSKPDDPTYEWISLQKKYEIYLELKDKEILK